MIRTLLVPFWNEDERRLRAPWRLLLGAAVYLVGSLAVGLVLSRGTLLALVGALDPAVTRALSVTLNGVVVVAAVAVAAVLLDRRRYVDYGFDVDRDWWLDLGFGLALGAALMTGVFVLELALGWVTVTDTFVAGPLGFAAEFALVLVVFLWVGLYEELMTRGYVLTNLAEGLRLSWPVEVGRPAAVGLATLLSSALFGFLHAANPNATAVSSVAIGIAGVMLALGYVLTGDLAIPIGLHVTWNLFQGTVYGFPVSGIGLETSVVAVEQHGPSVATGGSFGPEAGLVGLAAMAVGSVAIVAYVRRRYGRVALAPVDLPALRRR
jgi:hypothetical protein